MYDFFSGPELQVHLICKCLTTIQEKKVILIPAVCNLITQNNSYAETEKKKN